MAKISEKQLYNALQMLPKFGQYLSSAREKVVQALKTASYWTAVVALGLVISTGIMHAAGVPIFETAEALTAGQSLALLIGNILYYGWIGPYGILLIALAYILQIIINYPHGDFWQLVGNDNNAAVGYVNVEAVITGWKLVRDICNIFFSIILVIIALGSVLKIEKYSWKQLLPKFIVMAILINFSKSICGVFTDVATVAMATFAGSFGETFAIGLLGAFNITSLTEFTPSATSSSYEGTSAVGIVGAFLASAIMMLVFGIIITVLVAVFFLRIVMLWFLIVLSPMAYIARILPLTQSYSGKWWNMFGKWVVVGPLMTFFLWLTLTMAYGVETGNPIGSEAFSSEAAEKAGARVNLEAPGSGFQATSTNQLATFLVGTVMLLGSMKLTKDLAEGAGGIIGKAEGLGKAAFGGAIAGNSMRRLTSFGGDRASQLGNALAKRGTDADGNVSGFGRFARGAGNLVNYGSTVLAGTAFDPVNAVKQIGQRIESRSKTSKERFDAKYAATTQKGVDQTDAWVGRGGAKGALGAFAMLLTNAAAAAGKNGQTAWNNTFTMQGGYRTARHFGQDKKIDKLKEQETEQEALVKSLTDHRDEDGNLVEAEMHQEKYDSLARQRDSAKAERNKADSYAEAFGADGADISTLNLSGVDLNMNDQDMASAISGSIEQMQRDKKSAEDNDMQAGADAIQAQIDMLNEATSGENPAANLDELISRMRGATGGNDEFATHARQQMVDRMRQKNNEKRTRSNDQVGRIDTQLAPVNRDTLLSRKAEEDALRKIQTEIGERGTWKMPTNFEARGAFGKAVKEAGEQMQGMSKRDLRGQLQLHIKSSNQAGGIAALKELSGKYEGINDVMMEMGGSVDHEGASKMAKQLQQQLGMSPEGSYQLMAELLEKSGIAHLSGQFGEGANGWMERSEKDAAVVSEQIMKKNPAKLGLEHGMNAFVTKNASGTKLSSVGQKTLVAASNSWADTRSFIRLADSFKDQLADPEMVAQLRAGGANVEFIKKLERHRKGLSIT